MENLTEYPIQVLETIADYKNASNDFYYSARCSNELLFLKSKTFPEKFFFKVVGFRKANTGFFQLNFERKPVEIENVVSTWHPILDLDAQVEGWRNLVKRYEKVNPIFKDQIIEDRVNEFYSSFELTDEDAKSTLAIENILELDEYLDKTKDFLLLQKNEDNKVELGKIIENIDTLQSKLTSENKGEIAKAFSYVWARITKLGLPIYKKLKKELPSEIVKELIKYTMIYITGNHHDK